MKLDKEHLLKQSFFSSSIDAHKDVRSLQGEQLSSSLHIMHRIFAALGVYVVKSKKEDCHLNAMFSFGHAFRLITNAKEMLEKYRPNEKFTFLDVGCGFGNIVMIANELGFDGFGLDIQKPYCDIAKMLCGKKNIINQNAYKYADYSKYDCIYLFNPTGNIQSLKSHIQSKVKNGTVIIDSLCHLVYMVNR